MGYPRNLITTSNRCGTRLGPVSKHSLIDKLVISLFPYRFELLRGGAGSMSLHLARFDQEHAPQFRPSFAARLPCCTHREVLHFPSGSYEAVVND